MTDDEFGLNSGGGRRRIRTENYRTLPVVDGDEDGIEKLAIDMSPGEESDTESVVSTEEHGNRRLWTMTLLPDRMLFIDGPEGFKLIKFILYTFVSIIFMFHFVRWVEWENDTNLTVANIWLYEGNLIVMDATIFFFVGRLHLRQGVDNLEWLVFVLLANIYSSYITTFHFLQHSFTLFEMHCRWPFALWVFVFVVSLLVATVALLHVRQAIREGIFVQKLLELAIGVIIFLVPLLSSPYFHFHHWFAGWLVGMHCNFDTFWSRATMAWCWGCYINGIAVYGRDPVLTCGYGMYLSTSLHCPYLKCYIEAIRHPSNHTNIQPMLPPDWRNCSADTYQT